MVNWLWHIYIYQHDSFTKSQGTRTITFERNALQMSLKRCSYKLACETNELISVVDTLTRLSYILIVQRTLFFVQLLSLFYLLSIFYEKAREEYSKTLKKIQLIRAILNIKIIYKNRLPIFLSILSNLSSSQCICAHISFA